MLRRWAATAWTALRVRGALAAVLVGAVLIGAVLGWGVAGDIGGRFGGGPVKASRKAAPSPAASPLAGDRDLGEAYGESMAASLGITDRRECRRLRREFHAGCEAYVLNHAAGRDPD